MLSWSGYGHVQCLLFWSYAVISSYTQLILFLYLLISLIESINAVYTCIYIYTPIIKHLSKNIYIYIHIYPLYSMKHLWSSIYNTCISQYHIIFGIYVYNWQQLGQPGPPTSLPGCRSAGAAHAPWANAAVCGVSTWEAWQQLMTLLGIIS